MSEMQRAIDDYPPMAMAFVDTLWKLAQRHHCHAAGMHDLLTWLEERLSLLDEHEAILRKAGLPSEPRFSSPKQPERSGFAARLRQGQALSASQAMILVAEKSAQLNKENERLRQVIERQSRELDRAEDQS